MRLLAIDGKSVLIGSLATVIVVLVMGAGKNEKDDWDTRQRWQIKAVSLRDDTVQDYWGERGEKNENGYELKPLEGWAPFAANGDELWVKRPL